MGRVCNTQNSSQPTSRIKSKSEYAESRPFSQDEGGVHVVWDHGIHEPVEVDYGDGRVDWRDVPETGEGSPGVGGDAGDDVAQFGCGVVREAAAVGISRHVDAVHVEAVVVPYVVHQIPYSEVFF